MKITLDLPETTVATLLHLGQPARPQPWTTDLGDVAELDEIAVFAPNARADHVIGLVSYFLCGPLAMAGEWESGWAVVEPGGMVRFPLDITKSARDDAY